MLARLRIVTDHDTSTATAGIVIAFLALLSVAVLIVLVLNWTGYLPPNQPATDSSAPKLEVEGIGLPPEQE